MENITTENTDNNIDLVISVLIKDLELLGEDKDELEYWQSILEYMEPGQKDELAFSLAVEKAKLLKVRYKELPPNEELKLKNLTSFLVGRKQDAEKLEREKQDAQKIQELKDEIAKMSS